jgi:2-iminobutanoate/2-iminopropanoate deaminase
MQFRTWIGPSLTILLPLLVATTSLGAQERHEFSPPGEPTNLPFTPGIQVGDMLFIAGHEGTPLTGDIQSETKNALAAIKRVLDAAGFKVTDVVSVTVYLKDIKDFPKMNEVYRDFFPDPKPTRTTVQVAGLVNDARVEITSLALRNHALVNPASSPSGR